MRDPNRIKILIDELEKFWKTNPDFRLGQIITVATRPIKPHPSTFYIEDDKLLKGLIAMNSNQPSPKIPKAYWEIYPNVCRIELNEITDDLIEEYISLLRKEKFEGIITPIKLMELNGAPIDDKHWMAKQSNRITKLRSILLNLKNMGRLIEVEIGYHIKK
jgi:hypothetical protein